MLSTVKNRNIVNWIAAFLLALTLFASPVVTGTASAGCTTACIGTTDQECDEVIQVDEDTYICVNNGD